MTRLRDAAAVLLVGVVLALQGVVGADEPTDEPTVDATPSLEGIEDAAQVYAEAHSHEAQDGPGLEEAVGLTVTPEYWASPAGIEDSEIVVEEVDFEVEGREDYEFLAFRVDEFEPWPGEAEATGTVTYSVRSEELCGVSYVFTRSLTLRVEGWGRSGS